MDKKNLEGGVDKFKGRVKQTVGVATGDRDLEAEGKLDELKGKIKDAAGSSILPPWPSMTRAAREKPSTVPNGSPERRSSGSGGISGVGGVLAWICRAPSRLWMESCGSPPPRAMCSRRARKARRSRSPSQATAASSASSMAQPSVAMPSFSASASSAPCTS